MTVSHFSLSILLMAIFLLCESAGCKERPVVGGNCVYKAYPGTATITEVAAVEYEGGEGKNIFRVKFVFASSEPIREPFAQVEGREFELVASDFSHLSGTFLKKQGIEEGGTMDCDLKVITQGTCTPVLFEFPQLKPDEYTVK